MCRLSMIFGIAWSTLLALAPPGILSARPLAQSAGQSQPGPSTTFEQLQAAAASDVQNGENTKAISDIESALAIQPDWKEGWWNLGTLQYEANQYSEAARAFEKVVAYAPRMGPAWALLGLCEFELKRYEESLAHLETAQTIGLGDDAETTRVANYHFALLLIRQGQFERGVKVLHSTFGDGPPS